MKWATSSSRQALEVLSSVTGVVDKLGLEGPAQPEWGFVVFCTGFLH